MDKETKIGIWVLVIILVVFVFWQDSEKSKQITKLEIKLEEEEDKIESLENDNLFLNGQLCDIKNDNSSECEKTRQKIDLFF